MQAGRSGVTRLPAPADPPAARRFAERFADAAPGHTVPPDLLAAIGGNSPFLADLALGEPAVLQAIAAAGPDDVADRALASLARLPGSLGRRELAAGLRTARRHVALAAAVADIAGAWSLEQVTGALSDLADGALRAATAHLLRAAHEAGDLRLPYPAAPDRGSGLTVLALGKLGGRELNFSSDVDLILLYDPEPHAEHADRIGHVFTRMARDLVTLMEARDAGGYVFRVDLRLRPDPASTPPAMALPAALSYYESLGQTWERAALIKARPVAGDVTLGRRFLDAIRPFVWRRHLDFAALADIHGMKRRMDAHKGTALGTTGSLGARLLGHDLKLGQGGIREIEFCAQALQLVWGGREPALRVPATLAALRAMQHHGHVRAADLALLEAAYRFLRTAEHRLQMVADRQTHRLPETEAALAGFAVFLGCEPEAFAAEALTHLLAVHRIFTALFANLPAAPDGDGAAPPGDVPDFALAWMEGRPRALRTERSRALLREMLPAVSAAFARQPEPEAALARLDEFIHRLPAGVQVFSMLKANPALVERLADVFGAAPWLADHLVAVPAALEGLVGPQPIETAPTAALGRLLADAAGPDDALSIASGFVRAQEFAIGVGEYFGGLDVDEAAAARSALADAVIAALLGLVLRDHEARHGRVRGGGVAVVALGKLGSREMMAGSDLDLMLIYDHHAEAAESGGARPLAPSQYYARAAQALISALTVRTRHGPLYEVDMRLRPSGNKGPVAVSLAAFDKYHAEAAWTWERLALTRARVVAGPAGVGRRVAAALRRALAAGDPARILPDTQAMRERLARDHPPHGAWDLKHREGGLMETELCVQALVLRAAATGRPIGTPVTRDAIQRLRKAGAMSAADAARLAAAHRLWRQAQGKLRLALGRKIPTHLPAPVLDKLLPLAPNATDETALRGHLDALAQAAAGTIRRLLDDSSTDTMEGSA